MFSTDEWTGRTGDVWADEWRRTDRSFAGLSPVLNAAILAVAPDSGRAVDLGCGAGETAMALAAARPGLEVMGLDVSPNLIAVAKRRGAATANLSFAVADTAAIDPSTQADLFGSRHGVMFFDDPLAAFTTIRAAARPSAALAFSCFRARRENPWAMLSDEVTGVAATPPPGYAGGPFAFADRAFVADLLARSGWTDAEARPVDYRYIAGAGDHPLADAVDFLTRIGPVARAIAEQPKERRAGLIDRLRDALASRVADGVVSFPAVAWIWTARAGEPT